ncbi:MAG: acyl-CoA dehydrogenase [Steroidobacteraceae bacterium]|jgi:butyryl-CoA dehydrogenase|nr:acyl-CoA dehydrogenase [Steroidobacteraceae bacterium]
MLIPRRDIEFQVFEVVEAEALCARERYAAHDRATLDEVLGSARRLAEERFLPYAALTDVHEPELVDGRVRIAPEARVALRELGEAGFIAAPFDAEVGGLQVPQVVNQACNALFASAHVGFHGYSMLTQGVANVIRVFGSDEQRRRYLPGLLEGRFFGTMCLSEPHAGSSLADIRSRAEPLPGGLYAIRGDKMWISGGEHELSDNIIHLVLAKVPGGPPGVKGISLFIVPRYRVGPDGGLGADNDVRLTGLNHKMGWRGTVNTALAFGPNGECLGERIGEEHRGLASMFQLMNEARIGVGVCSVALGYAGYMNALAYARDRLQGRPLGQRDPSTPQVPILRHADVRRMLLAQKSWVEGGLALELYCARLMDDLATARDAGEGARLHGLVELLTPIAKSWPSEFCLEANKLAIQVLGGAGYTRDYPVERLYRDNRLNHIHEGAYGIHGLDLLGRKVPQDGGAALAALAALVRETIAAARSDGSFSQEADQLDQALGGIDAATRRVLGAMAKGEAERALANATVYLEAVGHVVVAWRWLEQARVATRALGTAGAADRAFYEGKQAACRFFFRHELPRVGPQLALVASLDETPLLMPDEGF